MRKGSRERGKDVRGREAEKEDEQRRHAGQGGKSRKHINDGRVGGANTGREEGRAKTAGKPRMGHLVGVGDGEDEHVVHHKVDCWAVDPLVKPAVLRTRDNGHRFVFLCTGACHSWSEGDIYLREEGECQEGGSGGRNIRRWVDAPARDTEGGIEEVKN